MPYLLQNVRPLSAQNRVGSVVNVTSYFKGVDNMSTELIAYTLALPIITFLLGVMYGGAEARKELKEQNRKVRKTA